MLHFQDESLGQQRFAKWISWSSVRGFRTSDLHVQRLRPYPPGNNRILGATQTSGNHCILGLIELETSSKLGCFYQEYSTGFDNEKEFAKRYLTAGRWISHWSCSKLCTNTSCLYRLDASTSHLNREVKRTRSISTCGLCKPNMFAIKVAVNLGPSSKSSRVYYKLGCASQLVWFNGCLIHLLIGRICLTTCSLFLSGLNTQRSSKVQKASWRIALHFGVLRLIWLYGMVQHWPGSRKPVTVCLEQEISFCIYGWVYRYLYLVVVEMSPLWWFKHAVLGYFGNTLFTNAASDSKQNFPTKSFG